MVSKLALDTLQRLVRAGGKIKVFEGKDSQASRNVRFDENGFKVWQPPEYFYTDRNGIPIDRDVFCSLLASRMIKSEIVDNGTHRGIEYFLTTEGRKLGSS